MSINQDRITKQINLSSGLFIISSNLMLFIPYTIYILYVGGGSWGYGYLFLPHSLIGILFLIPAVMVLKKTNRQSIGLLIFNIGGSIGSAFWLYVLISNRFFD